MLLITTQVRRILKHHYKINVRSLSGLNLWEEELDSEIKHRIENHWKQQLPVQAFNESDKTREKYYVLSMFPYPSGSLHMGHVRVYTISDSIARFQRMNGKNVLHPIGWDAFGLPAENAAIERKIAPDKWTLSNISHMKSQLETLGCSFDWDREITTCDPSYYKWTQFLFLKLYENKLIYQKEAMVNWDPVDLTVLADEQVDENGFSWRSGAKVEKKPLKQWFVRTTKFAKDLFDGLDDSVLVDWRDIIKLQKHWIGECNGVSFDFQFNEGQGFVSLWTPNPEFVKFAAFVAVSSKNILATREGTVLKDDVKRLNLTLKHPLTNAEIPVFVTDLLEYYPDNDAFLGIPCVNEQAKTFAKAHGIGYNEAPLLTESERETLQKEICNEALAKNVGGYWTSSKLRDWLISRQRFWGTPIPIVHCKQCGTQPVQKLPVQLPNISQLSEKGCVSHLQIPEWLNTQCPKCNGAAVRETDTMDTFVDSSWYYLRYLDPKNSGEMFAVDKSLKNMPVDLYIGGKEHAVLHLYYARFVSHFLHSLGLLPEREPFKRLLVQGMVMGRSYKVRNTGQYMPESRVKVIDLKKNKAVVESTGESVDIAWEKMSKSKHNGVDPGDMFKEYGVDTTRLLILADVAPTSHRNWNSNTFPGILNWQKRLWLTIRDFLKHRNNPPSENLTEDQFKQHDDFMYDSRNYYVKGTTFNYCISQQHSVAISKQQGFTNSIRKMPAATIAFSPQYEKALASQIILLAPMAPHFASELWCGFVSAPNRLNNTGEIDWDKGVLEQKWPKIDEDYNLDLLCQVNNEDVCVVKISKKDIGKISSDEAIAIALKQKDMEIELTDLTVLNISYKFHEDYNGIVNVRTNFVKEKKVDKKKKMKSR